nr:PREDICTED: zinc finger protein 133 [Anolis carolinensis]|eukprot:XP_008104166.1 PREDICTED: zinc finger protein 133 [Anolis carolinensis]
MSRAQEEKEKEQQASFAEEVAMIKMSSSESQQRLHPKRNKVHWSRASPFEEYGRKAGPLCTRPSSPQDAPRTPSVHQDQMTFREVAVDFSTEEWALLGPDQRDLHSEVMAENWGIVSTLGAGGQENEEGEPCSVFMQNIQREHMEEDETKCKIEEERRSPSPVLQTENIHELSFQEVTLKGEERSVCVCIACGISFHSRTSLILHQRTHVCKKLFLSEGHEYASALIAYEVTRTNEKPLQCLHCGKRFKLESCLRTHAMTHMGEKPFQCQKCGKRFQQLAHVSRHQATHSEKPFKCLKCGKGFGQKSSLMRHLATHSEERPYQCVACGKSFRQKRGLLCHQMTHTGENLSICFQF